MSEPPILALMSEETSQSTEDSVRTDELSEDKQLKFVTVLKKYKVLLEKSQLPTVKKAKQLACCQMLRDLETLYAIKMDEAGLKKKLNNMKTTVKKKTDLNETGNKKIVLSTWEKLFYELLSPLSNPVYSKVPGALAVGFSKPDENFGSVLALAAGTQSVSASTSQLKPPPPPDAAKRRKTAETILTERETDETALLSNTQLQRLVLLEQLSLIKMKQEKLKSKECANENKCCFTISNPTENAYNTPD